jgi:hypothetical protein
VDGVVHGVEVRVEAAPGVAACLLRDRVQDVPVEKPDPAESGRKSRHRGTVASHFAIVSSRPLGTSEQQTDRPRTAGR